MQKSSLILSATFLSACSTVSGGGGVDYLAGAPTGPDSWTTTDQAGVADTGDWISSFNDPSLTGFVKEALKANPTLEAQAAAVEAFRQQARSTYGRSLPSVSASGSAGYNSLVFEDLFEEPQRSEDPSFGLGLDASWEPDLWGRLGAGIDAARADLAASEADLAAARLSVAANTANAWLNLHAARAQLDVAEQTLEARGRVVTLTERRFGRGLSTALDVRLARSSYAQAEADIAFRTQRTGESARLLETLIGRYPANAIETESSAPELDELVIGGDPAALLARRPDIAGAEARVAAAGLRADQARLALRPSLRLSASVGTSDDEFENIFDPDYIAGQILGSLVQPIFNGGSLRADRDAAIAFARQAAANYASSALNAWREVEDAIAADGFLELQEDAQARALEEAVFAEDLAFRQYQNGLVSIFNLIDAQTRRLNAESALISARTNRAVNRVNYHLALGGGLPPSVLPEAVQAAGAET